MQNNSYSKTITVKSTPEKVFNAILDVPNWWSKDYEGASGQVNDEFIIHHPGLHYSKQLVKELIPGKRVAWHITESKMNWLKGDEHEWTDTRLIFELSTNGSKVQVQFTHEGLRPDMECYRMCAAGWDIVIGEWLLYLINEGKASEGMTMAAEIRGKAFEEIRSFHLSITAMVTPEKARDAICRVNDWWGCVEGETTRQNDRFTYRPNDTWVNFKVTICTNHKIVWHVEDCYLHFQENKTEWKNTDVVFDIVEDGALTRIDFTHVGLLPEIECYAACSGGWTRYINGSLLQLLQTGKGSPR